MRRLAEFMRRGYRAGTWQRTAQLWVGLIWHYP